MGIFGRNKLDAGRLTFTSVLDFGEEDWVEIGARWDGSEFGRAFMPAAVLDAVITSVEFPVRTALCGLVMEMSIAFLEANRDGVEDTEWESGFAIRDDVVTPVFRERRFEPAVPGADLATFMVVCELLVGGRREGATTHFTPVFAATTDQMVELFLATWDWLAFDGASDAEHVVIAQMLVSDVAIRHGRHLKNGKNIKARERGKVFTEAVDALREQ